MHHQPPCHPNRSRRICVVVFLKKWLSAKCCVQDSSTSLRFAQNDRWVGCTAIASSFFLSGTSRTPSPTNFSLNLVLYPRSIIFPSCLLLLFRHIEENRFNNREAISFLLAYFFFFGKEEVSYQPRVLRYSRLIFAASRQGMS